MKSNDKTPKCSFVAMYPNYFEMLEDFDTDKEKLEFIQAIYQYTFNDVEPIFNTSAQKVAWRGILPNLMNSKTKYISSIESGRQGGLKKAENKKLKEQQEQQQKTSAITTTTTPQPIKEDVLPITNQLNIVDELEKLEQSSTKSFLDEINDIEEDSNDTQHDLGYSDETFRLQNGTIVNIKNEHLEFWMNNQDKLGIMNDVRRNNNQFGFDYVLGRYIK